MEKNTKLTWKGNQTGVDFWQQCFMPNNTKSTVFTWRLTGKRKEIVEIKDLEETE